MMRRRRRALISLLSSAVRIIVITVPCRPLPPPSRRLLGLPLVVVLRQQQQLGLMRLSIMAWQEEGGGSSSKWFCRVKCYILLHDRLGIYGFGRSTRIMMLVSLHIANYGLVDTVGMPGMTTLVVRPLPLVVHRHRGESLLPLGIAYP